MVLRDEVGADAAARRRRRMLDAADARTGEAVGRAMRGFLTLVRRELTVDALTAASPETSMLDLGRMRGWWEGQVDAEVVGEVERTWRDGYIDTRDGELLSGSQRAVGEYVARTRDLLSRTATPTIPEFAFDTLRRSLAEELAAGSSRSDIQRRLAAEFGWDQDATYWRRLIERTDAAIDRRLDAFGPPGSAARRDALQSDPQVSRLIDRAGQARLRVDAVESTWQVRAERITRTETTRALNAGAAQAAADEGAAVKRWVATGDDRTREDHLDAHGQCVPMDGEFDVGGVALYAPGDAAGPPELTINCRCTLVYGMTCDELGQDLAAADERIDRERAERGG